MEFFVYILRSEIDGTFYKGFTTDYAHRLIQHNNGESEFTSHKMPWQLVYVQEFETKKEALIAEKKLKRCNKPYLEWLIGQKSNLLNINSVD